METQKTESTQDQLRSHCEYIRDTIENGIEVTQEDIDGNYYDYDYEAGDLLNASDYMSDVLDIEYRVDSKKEYKSAEILVAFGGPNIWIDTGRKKIIGAWWGDYCEVNYSKDAMGLDEHCEEIYNCI